MVQKWRLLALIALTITAKTGKFEIRKSPDFIKLVETNSNDQKSQCSKLSNAFVLNFEHSYFDIVSDFEFRYSNL